MKLIEQNPYRVLGVLSNSSQKEIVANYGKIKAFSKIKKTISFENDFNAILEPVIRTENALVSAYNAIALQKDRLASGMFWFMQSTDIDKVALHHLSNGDIDNAVNVLREEPNTSSCINLAVINLICKNWTTALYYYVYLLNDINKRKDFLLKLINNQELISENEIVNMFVDKLYRSYPEVCWMESLNKKEITIGNKQYDVKDFFKNSKVYVVFEKKIKELYVKKINTYISEADTAQKNNSKKNLEAAKLLKEKSKLLLHSLKFCFGIESKTYKQICDKVANQILNNCIVYYINEENNPHRANNIIDLLRYAVDTAKTRHLQERCKNNYEIIKKEIDSIEEKNNIEDNIYNEKNNDEKICYEHIKIIDKQIEEYKNFNQISNYHGYLESFIGLCFKQLLLIKEKVGEENNLYIAQADKIIEFAIYETQNEFNIKEALCKKNSFKDVKVFYCLIIETIEWAKRILQNLKDIKSSKSIKNDYITWINIIDKKYNYYKNLLDCETNKESDESHRYIVSEKYKRECVRQKQSTQQHKNGTEYVKFCDKIKKRNYSWKSPNHKATFIVVMIIICIFVAFFLTIHQIDNDKNIYINEQEIYNENYDDYEQVERPENGELSF